MIDAPIYIVVVGGLAYLCVCLAEVGYRLYQKWYVRRLQRLEREYIANARKLGITYEDRNDFAFWSWIGDDNG